MKKSLIALAILGSVAGVAQAQSSVTLYGLVDVWAGRTKAEVVGVGSASVTGLNSGGLATSRWGVQGSEDLGGGLKAIFKLEQGFDASNGTANVGTAFDRQSWVGLEGSFGTVQVGNVWSAFDDIFYIGNAVFDGFPFSPAYGVLSVAAYNDKPRNAVRYTTPNFGGFSATVSHGLDENPAVKTDQTDFNLLYAAGPLTAAFAYQVQNDAAGIDADAKFTYFTAAYDFGVAVLKGGVGTTRNVFASKTNDWQIGVDFPLSSALTLSTGYASSKDKDGTDTKRSGFSVGALYALSKRTSTYAAFTKEKGEVPGVIETKGTVFGAGIQHKF